MARTDTYRNFRFQVEINRIIQAGFNECSFVDESAELAEYREGIDPPTNRKLSSQTKYGNITLKCGITESLDLYNWYKLIVDSGATDAKKNISIILIDETENDKSRWNIVKAWPTKYDATEMNAKGNDVAIETLEIVHEGFERVS